MPNPCANSTSARFPLTNPACSVRTQRRTRHAPCSALLVFRGFFGRRFGGRLFSRPFFSRRVGDFFCRCHFGGLRFGRSFGDQCLGFHRTFCRRLHVESRFGGGLFSAFQFRGGYSLAAIQSGKVIIDRNTDFFHRFRANAFNRFQLLRRHIGQ